MSQKKESHKKSEDSANSESKKIGSRDSLKGTSNNYKIMFHAKNRKEKNRKERRENTFANFAKPLRALREMVFRGSLKFGLLAGAATGMLLFHSAYGEDGKTLFQNNCAACHSIGKGRLVGPDLKDVHTRHPEEWLFRWTKSSSSLIKAGEPEGKTMGQMCPMMKSNKSCCGMR